MKWQEYIGIDEGVLVGKPTIKGTRISIDFLIGLFAQGWSEKEILENYPRVSKDALLAVFQYIHECMEDSLLIPTK